MTCNDLPVKLRSAYELGLSSGQTLVQKASYLHDAARCLAKVIGWETAHLEQKVTAFHRERLDAVPDLTIYPELRGYRDLLDAEERGILESGADATLIALSKSLGFWRLLRLPQETGKPGYATVLPERCRVLYLADSDRGALHLKNMDDPLTYWKPLPPCPPGSPWPHSHPLVFDRVGSGLHIDEVPPEIFPVDTHTLCKEHCTTVSEAEQFMVHYNYFWGSQNLLVHDQHGNSAAFEKTWCRVATRGPNAAGINFINGMGALNTDMADFHRRQRQKYLDTIGADWNSADGCYFTVCENKWKNMARYVEALSLAPTWDNAKQLMEQRAVDGPMCLTGTKSHPEQKVAGCTLRMDIFEMGNKRLHRRQWRGQVPAFLDTPEIVQFV